MRGILNGMTTPVRVSIDDFLAMEETKPYLELIDGEVVEKAMPNPSHSSIVVILIRRLANYLDESKEARVDTEMRHLQNEEQRVYLPDVSVTLNSRFPKGMRRGLVETHPDFAIEVLSPDDRAARVLDRVQFYLRAGVRLVWLVDPELRVVFVYRPGVEGEEHRAPESIDASPVLKDFSLDLAELFAVLDEQE